VPFPSVPEAHDHQKQRLSLTKGAVRFYPFSAVVQKL
ncbi:hypothetical protein A2U01_0061715, partial [Trifolium medium]|nr:hypothetical protein [Trifolium medium]